MQAGVPKLRCGTIGALEPALMHQLGLELELPFQVDPLESVLLEFCSTLLELKLEQQSSTMRVYFNQEKSLIGMI